MAAKTAIDACHHIAVVVRDATEARAFYGDVLGLERLPRPAELDEKFPGAWYKLGVSELHVFQAAPGQELP
jgi:catechol 2,3-dioxygenase-like lactoylglutathione lyase family enzyme